MSYGQNPYSSSYSMGMDAASAAVSERVGFIRRTYLHLALAMLGFVGIEMLIFAMVPQETLLMVSRTAMSGWNWLFVIGGFMVVSWLAQSWANSGASKTMQYAGLSLFVGAEAIIFLPLLAIAHTHFPGTIGSAAVMTLTIFGGLTAFTWLTNADFSFLRGALVIGGFGAIGFIICAIFFGAAFGGSVISIGFSCFMIVLMSGYILYETSNILHHYQTDQHVAAALALFSSVATLFWYVLRLFMSMRD
ncbi:Bax inhibitor-1/YccA family protein [Lignipirellula cremea]|uniref:Inhibitor of apoptosis-promoting Bax1 n=1 Tax=Lignipirellula cremea TaxID=2528010 RepID=A0A518E0Z6_9BACT|nr:Bax inhibitor-1 family protein [Lignipirellula cremea]QDU97765.1 Inhibitor of apoptosis-promoting Bax1 [Lignipirellula cremea]